MAGIIGRNKQTHHIKRQTDAIVKFISVSAYQFLHADFYQLLRTVSLNIYVCILSIFEIADLLPLKDVPQVLQAQALQELTYIHVQHCHCKKKRGIKS